MLTLASCWQVIVSINPFHTGFHNTYLPNFNFCVILDPRHFGPRTKLVKEFIDISWGRDDMKLFGCLKHQLSLLSCQLLFWKPQAIANLQGTFCTNTQRRRRMFWYWGSIPGQGNVVSDVWGVLNEKHSFCQMNCNYATKTQKDDPCQKCLAFYLGAFNHFLDIEESRCL